jgi:alcohol dehydrogenase
MSLAIVAPVNRAWRFTAPGSALSLDTSALPTARRGTAVLRMQSVPLLSYLRDYVAGHMPYAYPPAPFTPGTNGIGIIESVGEDVYHLAPGMRVFTSPYLVADETADEPAQILMGLTAIGDDHGMLAAWPNGTLAERIETPVSVLTSLARLDRFSAERLAALGKFAVPFGGLSRGRLAAGETLVVSGASGYFGSAAVLLGVALGARRVIATARDGDALDALKRAAGPRVASVVLQGDALKDAAAIREAAGGKVDCALDMVGRAGDPTATLAALKALRRGGRLVLMGSMTVPLPLTYAEVLANDWEIIGNFMYDGGALRRLAALVADGFLDLELVRLRSFPFEELNAAMGAAATMRGLDCTVVTLK